VAPVNRGFESRQTPVKVYAIMEYSYSQNHGNFHFPRALFLTEELAKQSLELLREEFEPSYWEEHEFHVSPVTVYESPTMT